MLHTCTSMLHICAHSCYTWCSLESALTCLTDMSFCRNVYQAHTTWRTSKAPSQPTYTAHDLETALSLHKLRTSRVWPSERRNTDAMVKCLHNGTLHQSSVITKWPQWERAAHCAVSPVVWTSSCFTVVRSLGALFLLHWRSHSWEPWLVPPYTFPASLMSPEWVTVPQGWQAEQSSRAYTAATAEAPIWAWGLPGISRS